jgi:Arc/MetJ-type ribon-helix-helix transcriptional regulator
MTDKKTKFPLVTVKYDGKGCLEYVVADNLAVPGGAMHLVTNLVRLGIYSDIGAAIRAGIRLLIEQNRDSLLAAEARMARRQIVNALQEAEVKKE